MAKCRVCGREASVYIPHSRLWLCREHFNKFLMERVRRTVKRYGLIRRGDKVVVAVSGGKDSIVLTKILSELKEEMGFHLIPLHLDLGIPNYSDLSKKLTIELTSEIGVKPIVIELRRILGMGIPELSLRTRRPPCSVCGIVKRYMLNLVAVELGADSIATGHNLDDITAFIVKEFLVQDLGNIHKLLPKTPGIPGFLAQKIRPLYETYEEDIRKYAEINNIEYVEVKCPFAEEKTLTNHVKKYLKKLEESFPGIMIGFIRRFVKNIDKYPRPEMGFQKCQVCGMPSSSEVCSFCRITARAIGKPMGPNVREHVRKIINEYISTQ